MTLTQLHDAIRPQFIWISHEAKDLQTDAVLYKGTGSKGIASICFIGIAFMHGFKTKDVRDYLNIETKEEHQNKLATFRTAMRDPGVDRQTKLIHLKTSLTLNYLRLHKKVEIVSIDNFRF